MADGDGPSADDATCVARDEIAELREFAALATSIKQNAKGAPCSGVESWLRQGREFGAAEKAIIFTESAHKSIYCASWRIAMG